MRTTGIGAGVVLLVIGAILNWAVADRISGVDLHMIGLICMGGGILAIVLGLLAGAGSRTA
jgi:hypothetical protein